MSSVDSGVIFELVPYEIPIGVWVLVVLAIAMIPLMLTLTRWTDNIAYPLLGLVALSAFLFGGLGWGISSNTETREANSVGLVDSVESHYDVALYSESGLPLAVEDTSHHYDDDDVVLVREGYHSVDFVYDGVLFSDARVMSDRSNDGEVGLTLLVSSEDGVMESDGFTEFAADLVK